MEDQPLPPVKIAFIIDNVVVDVLHTDSRLAAIFLSDPLILDVTKAFPMVGAIYDPATKTFRDPEAEPVEPEALDPEVIAAIDRDALKAKQDEEAANQSN